MAPAQQQQQQNQAASAAQQPIIAPPRMHPRKAPRGRAARAPAAAAVQPAAVALQRSQPAARRPAVPGAAQPMRAGEPSLRVASCHDVGWCCLLLLLMGDYSAESAGPICMHNPGCEYALSGLVFMSLHDSLAPHIEQATLGLESRSLSSLSLCQAKAGLPSRQPTSQTTRA